MARHGKLVFERYFNGSDAGEANLIASVSKSILSLVTGIAIEDGLLDLDTRIDRFLPPDLVGDHGDLTVEQLLTMSGGLPVDDPESWYEEADSFVRVVLERPSVAPAGTKYAYDSGLAQVLGAVLTEASGMTLCDYTTEHLLSPLGIDVERWWVEPGGYDTGGVYLTPRELARIGQLVLQGGMWDGRQLVPKPWLDLTLAERWDLGCRGVRPVHVGYGYLWWPLDVDGHQVWLATGYGNQQLWIIPDMDLVFVITHDATNVGDPDRRQVTDYDLARSADPAACPGRACADLPCVDRGGRHDAAGWDRPCRAARLAGRRPRVVVVARWLPDRAGAGRARSQLRDLHRRCRWDRPGPAHARPRVRQPARLVARRQPDRLRPGRPGDQRPVPRRPRRVRPGAADRLRRVRERAHVVARRQPHRVRVGPHRDEGLRRGRAALGDGGRRDRGDAAARSRRRVPLVVTGRPAIALEVHGDPVRIGVLDLETAAP